MCSAALNYSMLRLGALRPWLRVLSAPCARTFAAKPGAPGASTLESFRDVSRIRNIGA